MKIVAISCVAALVPFVIIYLLPQLILKRVIFPAGLIIFFGGIIPLGMGYAVITRRLWDIDIIIRRGLIYGLISIIMSIFLAAGILPAMSLLHNTNVWQELAIISDSEHHWHCTVRPSQKPYRKICGQTILQRPV